MYDEKKSYTDVQCKYCCMIAETLNRPWQDLLMRSANQYPQWVEKRMAVARAVEARDLGTGECDMTGT